MRRSLGNISSLRLATVGRVTWIPILAVFRLTSPQSLAVSNVAGTYGNHPRVEKKIRKIVRTAKRSRRIREKRGSHRSSLSGPTLQSPKLSLCLRNAATLSETAPRLGVQGLALASRFTLGNFGFQRCQFVWISHDSCVSKQFQYRLLPSVPRWICSFAAHASHGRSPLCPALFPPGGWRSVCKLKPRERMQIAQGVGHELSVFHHKPSVVH